MADRLPAGTAWLGLTGVAIAGALLAATAPAHTLDWEPARAATEPWRALTGALAHHDARHLLANLGAAVLVGAFGPVARLPTRTALAWAAAWPLTQLALLAIPMLQHYQGLSGVMHAGVAAAAVHLVLDRDGTPRHVALAMLAGLGVKVLLEAPWHEAVQALPGWNMPVAVVAHATGAAAGVGCAALGEAWARLRRPLAAGS